MPFLGLTDEFFFQGKAGGANKKIDKYAFHLSLETGGLTFLGLREDAKRGDPMRSPRLN
jgi:hypothetical protein